MKNYRILSISLAFAICTCASSAELSYTCVVLGVYDLDDNGLLEQLVYQEQFQGSRFSVSRITGEIIGEVIPTLKAVSTSVINAGSREYSFKTTASFDNQIQVLEVKEFKYGEAKPFVSMSMGGAGIVTGVCK